MHTAKIFTSGNSQAVRLPKQYRIAANEVFIRRDADTGDIVLSTRPAEGGWAAFFALRDKAPVTADFMRERPMNALENTRDPFPAMPATLTGSRSPAAKRSAGKKR